MALVSNPANRKTSAEEAISASVVPPLEEPREGLGAHGKEQVQEGACEGGEKGEEEGTGKRGGGEGLGGEEEPLGRKGDGNEGKGNADDGKHLWNLVWEQNQKIFYFFFFFFLADFFFLSLSFFLSSFLSQKRVTIPPSPLRTYFALVASGPMGRGRSKRYCFLVVEA